MPATFSPTHVTPTHQDPAYGVRLEPLSEAHRSGLAQAAADTALWRWMPVDPGQTGWDAHMDWQLREQAAGRWLLHTVVDTRDLSAGPAGRIVGQTCYLNLRPHDRSVEIGGTWYAASAHATHVNPACKLALLSHAFDIGAERVELKTDALNARSRAAITKLGASFEGIFRRHMLMADGRWRDTAWFSIIAPEWPQVRARLLARLADQLAS